MSKIILSVKNLSIHFKSVKAVNNVSFDLYEGETFGLVGESGSGKSTIIRSIMALNDITSGEIIYKDFDFNKLNTKSKKKLYKDIQMIYQDPGASLNNRANVEFIVSEGLRAFKFYEDDKDRLDKVLKMLDKVGLLKEHLSRYPHEFSGGQRQRIGIARSLVIEPKIVLADEPISALDVSIRAQVLNLMKKMQKEQNLSYIFVAHDLSIVRYISDRIGVMHRGHLVEIGNAEEIYQNPIHPYTKSLLKAIPQPSPKHEKIRKIEKNIININYEECEMIEISKGRFILCDEVLKKELT